MNNSHTVTKGWWSLSSYSPFYDEADALTSDTNFCTRPTADFHVA